MATVKSYPWTAKAIATIGGNKTTIKTYNSTTDVDEGANYAIIVDKVIEYNGEFYGLNDATFAPNTYGISYTMGGAAASYEYTYEKIDDIVFYGEVENIFKEGKAQIKQENITVLSNGGGYTAQSSNPGHVTVAFKVPEDGIYTVVLGTNNTNGKERGFNYAIDNDAVSETITVNANTAYVLEISNKALVAGDHTLTMNITYSLTPVFDYVMVKKVPTVTAAITSECEMATFCSDKALDFSNVEGLTAWIVTGIDGVAYLQQVKKVPAGTGIILQGAPKTYEVPVIATADAIEGNQLIAATTDHTAVEGDYVLAYRSDTRGFFIAEDELKIPAGKAYLHIDSGEAPAFLPFAAETTGIGATLVNSEVVNNEIFNLAGQRVAQPTKGLYIVGGRKVVVK